MYTKVSDLENIVVAPGPILLKDVATVFFDLKDETTYSRVNGKEAVSVALINDSQANLIELSHRVSDVIEKLNEKLAPLELEIVIQENKAETMENNINQIISCVRSLAFPEEYAAGVFYRTFHTDFCLYGFQLLLRFWYYYQ